MKNACICLLFLTALAAAEPEPQCRIQGGYETYLEISDDGKRALLNRSTSLAVFDLDRKVLLRELRGFERLTGAAFSPKGHWLAVGDYPRWLGMFDCGGSAVKKIWEYKAPWSGQGSIQLAGGPAPLWSPDSRFLLTVDGSHGAQMGWPEVHLMDARRGLILKTYQGWGGRKGGGLYNFAFTLDSKNFLRVAQDKLQMYSVPQGLKVREARLPGLWGNRLEVGPEHLEVSHNGAGGIGHQTSRYSISDFKPLGARDSHSLSAQHPEGSLRYESKGDELLVTVGDQSVFQGKGAVKYWVPQGGFVLTQDDQEEDQLFDASGKKLASLGRFCRWKGNFAVELPGYGGPCKFYDLLTGKLLAQLSFAYDVACSKDGRRAVFAMKKGILIVDLVASRREGKLVPLP